MEKTFTETFHKDFPEPPANHAYRNEATNLTGFSRIPEKFLISSSASVFFFCGMITVLL